MFITVYWHICWFFFLNFSLFFINSLEICNEIWKLKPPSKNRLKHSGRTILKLIRNSIVRTSTNEGIYSGVNYSLK